MYDNIELGELQPIDAALVGDELAPFPECRRVSKTTLQSIIEDARRDELDAAKSEIAMLSRPDLNYRLLRAKVALESAAATGREVSAKTRLSLWLCNEECTRRGIPPVFRNLPDPSDDDPDQVADMFAIDLQWQMARYPKHILFFKRWASLFKPSRFHSTSDWIGGQYPRRAMYWFCKGLNLSDDQQRELHFIKREGIRKDLNALKAKQEEVRVKLAAAYHARDIRYKTTDNNATINRRAAIWFVGSLAGWKPQRTADLYEAHTGERITRQLAANIIDHVHRDLPESRPRPRPQRSKKRNSAVRAPMCVGSPSKMVGKK